MEVVKNVELKINDKEFLTILGPSGSGKTTLLTLIAGFESPTTGSILINNRSVGGLPPNRRNIGLMFQSYALFPHMSVFDNVAFPLTVRKYNKNEINTQVMKMLELVQLGRFKDRRINELSGGQQQRVALARAISFNPDILLLDEPLAALDRKLRQMVQMELRELQRSLGITTINVTHDQEEAMIMSDRILILNDGKVEQVGTPEVLYECPENRFVAEFLGSANLFEGRVFQGDTGKQIKIEGDAYVNSSNIQSLEIGSEGVLMIRPDNINLSPVRQEGKEGIDSIVKSVNYLGGERRYQIESKDGKLMNVIDNAQYSEGEKIVVSWDPQDSWFISENTTLERVVVNN